MRDQVALDLADRVHRHVDDDQQAGPAEVEGHPRLAERNLGDQADQRQIGRADDGDAVEQIIEILLGRLARTNAGNEAAVALEVFRGLFRIELHRGVEEAEEHDPEAVQRHEQRRAVLEIGRQRDQPVARRGPAGGALGPRHLQHRQRHQQQRRGEDRRDHARGVDLDRKVTALGLHHPARALALGVLDQHASLRPLHEADEQHQPDHQRDDRHHQQRVHRPGAPAFEQLRNVARQRGDNPRHDDQRHAVADPAAGDLLADPHQEQGTADQADGRGDAEQEARLDDRADALARAKGFEPDGDEIALHRGQQHGQVTRVLVELLAPDLAFLLERRPGRVELRAELHHDRRGDVGHHAKRDHRHPAQRPARERVEEVEHAALLGLEQRGQRARIDPRDRDERQQAEQDQRAQREEQALLELGRLGETAPRQVGGKLFGCGCHR